MSFFNAEQQIKGNESAIKKKVIDLLPQLKGFEFVTTLVLEFKKTQSDVKHYIAPLSLTQK